MFEPGGRGKRIFPPSFVSVQRCSTNMHWNISFVYTSPETVGARSRGNNCPRASAAEADVGCPSNISAIPQAACWYMRFKFSLERRTNRKFRYSYALWFLTKGNEIWGGPGSPLRGFHWVRRRLVYSTSLEMASRYKLLSETGAPVNKWNVSRLVPASEPNRWLKTTVRPCSLACTAVVLYLYIYWDCFGPCSGIRSIPCTVVEGSIFAPHCNMNVCSITWSSTSGVRSIHEIRFWGLNPSTF